ncbi:MAG: BspA family leucine-rich repeat surface protein [Bacteroidota bacterium]
MYKLLAICLVLISFSGNSSELTKPTKVKKVENFNPFITTWRTTQSNESITIPTVGSGYNYSVDWGDGQTDANVTGNISHIFSSPGTYTVEITGDFPRIYFNYSGSRAKILTVEQWGDIAWTSMDRAFFGCTNLRVPATDAPDLSLVTSLGRMFSNAHTFNENIDHWNVSNVVTMHNMFERAYSFNKSLNSWDVINVTNMSRMFLNAFSFNQDLDNWDVSAVTNMFAMFCEAYSFNGDIANWSTNSVTNMGLMLMQASQFDQDLSQWDVTGVTNMSRMLELSGLSFENYDLLLNAWSLQPVQSGVKFGATGVNYCQAASARTSLSANNGWKIHDGGIGKICNRNAFVTKWETTGTNESITIPRQGSGYDYSIDWGDGTTEQNSVSHIYANPGIYQVTVIGDFPQIYFANAGDKDKIVSVEQWGSQKWRSMVRAFQGAVNLELNTEDTPDLSLASDASYMFQGAISFDQDIGSWDVSSISNMEGMLSNSGVSTQTFDAILLGWAQQLPNLQTNLTLGADDLKYCVGSMAHGQLVAHGWTITDSGPVSNCSSSIPFITTWKTDNPGMSMANQITIPTVGSGYYYSIDWGDGQTDTNVQGNITHTYSTPGTYQVAIEGDFPRIYFNGIGDKEKILSVEQWGRIHWKSMEKAFTGASNLVLNATDTPDLSRVLSMGGMFQNAISFNSPIGNWDVSNIRSMPHMFFGASTFNQELNDWDVSNVRNMYAMFYQASSFNQNLGTWDVSNVTSVWNMFLGATSFNQSLGSWDVSSVTDFSDILSNSGLSASNYDSTLIGWSQLAVLQRNLTLRANSLFYCIGGNARQYIVNTYNWNIIDKGELENCQPPPPIITVPPRSCTPTAVTVSAAVAGSGEVKWYDAATDGNLLTTGSSYTTPGVLTGNTYFYATQTIDGIESERAVGLAEVGPPYSKPQDTTICRGDAVNLYAFSSEDVSISWQQVGSMEEFGDRPDSTRYYKYTITSSLEGCTATDSIKVTVLDLPEIGLVDSTQTVCPGSPLTLEAVPVPGASYYWEPGGFETRIINIAPTSEVYYTLTVTAQDGCSVTKEIRIPYLNYSGSIIDMGQVCLIDSIQLVADASDAYLWSTGQTSQRIWYQPPSVGIDTISIALSKNGCIVDQEFRVEGIQGCPGIPIGFNATALGTDEVKLKWLEPIGDQTIYIVEKAVGTGPFTQLFQVPVGIREIVDTGLDPATYYRYRIFSQHGPSTENSSNASSAARTFDINMNYVLENIPTTKRTNLSDVENLSKEDRQISFTYMNGLGSHIQTVLLEESPGGNDIIQTIYTDDFGRNSRNYLSFTQPTVVDQTYVGGTYRSNAETAVIDYYQAPPEGIQTTNFPYSEVEFEDSPRNRVLKAGSVGDDYQLAGGNITKNEFFVNDSQQVLKWTIVGDHLEANSYYSPGLLSGSKIEDAEGKVSRSYTDQLGRTVFSQQKVSSTQWTHSYSIFDDQGKLLVTLPPKLMNEVLTSQAFPFEIANERLNALAFQYTYDSLDRLITEKQPGIAEVRFVYDDWDRVILSQDGNQRSKNQWSFVKYDKYNRAVLSGFYYDGTHLMLEQIQSHVDDYYLDSEKSHNVFLTAGGPLLGYSDTAFPEGIIEDDLLSATYFEHYSFKEGTSLGSVSFILQDELDNSSNDLEVPTPFYRLKGQATGSVTKLLGTSQFLRTLYYYDDEGQLIQSIKENHLGGLDILSSQYDFSGKIRNIHALETTDLDSVETFMEYEYDHGDRLVDGFHTLNGGDRVHLFHNEYNEIGQLLKKHLHEISPSDFEQTLDYSYHVKGWVEGINKEGLNDPAIDPKDLFKMELIYDSSIGSN